MPVIGVYWGEAIENAGLAAYARTETPGLIEAAPGHTPPDPTTYPGEPDLGRHIIQSLVTDGFDIAHSCRMPAGNYGTHSIGHAFGWVYRQLMHDDVIPNVPVFLNTYYPPNQPTMKRCFELGKAIRRAVATWDNDKTVAVVASGGLTHFVIEEELDQRVIKAMRDKDESLLTDMPMSWFQSGTSEIRNWAVVAGAMHDGDQAMRLVDYLPCYRSQAGTGCAMAFAEWR
ncbi:MAG: protocatechuate 3,4-dioxygenase, partial [Chloroflexi bacterium]|nr:protocatechuate 3,4-dioxygenase [Chloroflexota bacterium]